MTGGGDDILAGLDPVELAVALSQRPPTDQLVIAARLAVEQSHHRWDRAAALSDAAKDACRDGVTLPDPREAQRVWEARAEADGPGSYAAQKAAHNAAGISEVDDPARQTEIAERQLAWARTEAEIVDRQNALDEYRANRDGTDVPLPQERDTDWDGPGRTRTAAEERESADRTARLVNEAQQGTAAIIAEAHEWVARRDADEADLERRAEEARWREEDHAEEIRDLEQAHPDLHDDGDARERAS